MGIFKSLLSCVREYNHYSVKKMLNICFYLLKLECFGKFVMSLRADVI